jgi:hypothetical protein
VIRAHLAAASAGLAAAVGLAGCGSGPAKPPAYPRVFGSVGPGASISLNDTSGNAVTRLKPGTYTFRIADHSTSDDFHLVGPTVDLRTVVKTRSAAVWSPLILNPGTYRYYSDADPKTLSGSFRVR